MKIAFFIVNPLTVFGGFEKVLKLLVSHLDKKGVQVLICKLADMHEFIPNKSFWIDLYQNHECLIVRYSWQEIFTKKLAHWLGMFRISEKSENLSNDVFKDLDIAVVNFPLFLQTVSTFLTKTGFKGKIVGWFHGSLFGSDTTVKILIKKTLFRASLINQLKRADLVLAISSGIEKQVKKLLPSAEVTTVYNPVLPADYERIPPVKRSNKPIFVYVGRISNSEKNLKFMFKGLSMLKFDWKLKIIGTGPDEEVLKEYSKKLGIQDKIEWLGFSKEPYELLRDEGATALLLTSHYEGLPTVLIESISYGIPVISSDCETGPSDIVVEGVNGYLYEPGNLKEFVEKVSGLAMGKLKVADPVEMKKTVKKFQIDTVCESIYDEFKRVLQKDL